MTQLQNDVTTIANNLQNTSNATAFLENILLNTFAVETDVQTA